MNETPSRSAAHDDLAGPIKAHDNLGRRTTPDSWRLTALGILGGGLLVGDRAAASGLGRRAVALTAGVAGANSRTMSRSRSDVSTHASTDDHQRCSTRRNFRYSSPLNMRRGMDRSAWYMR